MSRLLPPFLLLAAGWLASVPVHAVAPLDTPYLEKAGGVPKTVILGFDGMDFALTQQFMDAGLMPNFKRLAEQGLFQPLETSNPAQSPVSWAVLNTGCNPGKTGVAGFISREFNAKGMPTPEMMLGFPKRLPADPFVEHPLALQQPDAFRRNAMLVGAGAGLLVGLLLFKLVFRMGWGAAFVIALLLSGGGAYGGRAWAQKTIDGLPPDGKLPYVVNPMQGKSFWSFLDQRGVRMRGIQIASTYPPDGEGPNTKLLSGLGVMDISGSPGTYFVYTDDKWEFGDKSTGAGKLIKVYEDEPNTFQSVLQGPKNWFAQAGFDTRLKELKERGAKPDAPADVKEQIKRVEEEQSQWNRENGGKCVVPFTMVADRAAHAVDFTVGGGQRFRLKQGEWSGFVPVEYRFSDHYSAHGVAMFHVIRCDDEQVRVFVPPINIDPLKPPDFLPISAPPGFAAELQGEIGQAYETLGWACITTALKDVDESKLPEQSFLDDLVATEALREELLIQSLKRASEWDVFFQVLSTPDRVCHMLFREYDPGHPAHDAALADQQVTAWGQTFPLKEAIPKLYAQEDRLLGRVLDVVDSGALGKDCLLMIVSDHGFSSFRRQVNLNNVLAELGYLVFLEGLDVESARAKGDFKYVDWTKTRAYSMGLGEVFINLVGREPQGIVAPEDYDAVVEAIRKDLLELKDPADGASVVTSAGRRDVLYSGPWWKEGTASRKERGVAVEVHHDGFADIFLGYRPNYRVAWSNSTGGLDSAAITDNDNHWSGDHVSVDPSHVPGVLLSNRKLSAPAEASLMDIAPTMLARYGLDPAPPHTEMDGKTLPFENLTR
jgi:predicted AlkP superfamily phosphohydrolase/phosphomutase